jgi:hypothetical protein
VTTTHAGDLVGTSLPALLRPLVWAKKTGVLRMRRGRIGKSVYIAEGRLIFATSTDPDDRLGEMLLRKGLITFRALEESVRALSAGKRQGSILVENGAIRAKDLVDGVTEQVQEIIYGLLRWDEGSYEFVEGDLPSREVIVLRMSTTDLLMEGVRRIQSWGLIRSAVGGLDQHFRLSPDSGHLISATGLSKEELNVIASVDGTMSLDEILGAARQPDFLVCRAIFGLWAAGILDRVPQETGGTVEERGEHDKTEPFDLVRGATVADEIDRFNELHQLVFEEVRRELEDLAPSLMQKAFLKAEQEHPKLFAGVSVDEKGELDAILLQRNILTGEISRYLEGLDRLLEIERQLAREVLGEQRAGLLEEGLFALRRRHLVTPR